MGIFETKRKGAAGGRKILHHEKLQDLCFSLNILTVVKDF
jgi:hypothetical protein